MMGLDVWFREDVARILAAIAIARDGLTSDERTILAAICAGFGVSLAEVLTMDGSAVPLERQAIMQLPPMAEQPAAEEVGSARRFIHRP